jgi:hypothetical protein
MNNKTSLTIVLLALLLFQRGNVRSGDFWLTNLCSSTKEVDDDYFKETEEDDEKGPAFRNGIPEPAEFKPLTHDNTEEPTFTDVLKKSPLRNGSDDGESPKTSKKTKISFNLKSASFLPRENEDSDISDQDTKRRKVE